MAELLLSALFTAFPMVRLIKGSWLQNPHYLASAFTGAMAFLLGLQAYWPGMENDFFVGSLAGAAGSWGGMVLFDVVIGLL